MTNDPTIFINVDEEYPAFKLVKECEAYPAQSQLKPTLQP
jgi:hypothetical protein